MSVLKSIKYYLSIYSVSLIGLLLILVISLIVSLCSETVEPVASSPCLSLCSEMTDATLRNDCVARCNPDYVDIEYLP